MALKSNTFKTLAVAVSLAASAHALVACFGPLDPKYFVHSGTITDGRIQCECVT